MNQRIEILLQKIADSTASEQEVDELVNLLKDDPTHAEAARVIDARFQLSRSEGDGQTQHENVDMIRRILESDKKHKATSTIKKTAFAAVAFAVVIVSLTYYFVAYQQASSPSAGQPELLTVSGKGYVRLPDGSTVFVNEGAELIYASDFGQKNRELQLKGEAYFDVTHSHIPFQVRTGKIVTTVLGTAFNINATAEAVSVTVTRGKVAVGDSDSTYGILTPNEQLAVNTINHAVLKSAVDSTSVVKWKENYFVLDHVTFAEAAKLIEKRFDVAVSVTNPALQSCIVSAWFLNDENLQQIVDGISLIQQAHAEIHGNEVTITGGVGCREEKSVPL